MNLKYYAWFSMILFTRLLVGRFLLPAVSSPQTENTRSTYASDAGADSRSLASGANSGYLLAFVTQNLSPLFSDIIIEIYILCADYS